MGGAVGEKSFLVFQQGFGHLHQGLASLGHALFHPFRLTDLVAQVFLQLRGIGVAVHLTVVTVNFYIRIHGFIEKDIKVFLKLYNGHVRYDIPEFFPAAKGDPGLGIQGFDDLAVSGCLSRGQAQFACNGGNLVFCHHFQTVINNGGQNGSEHLPSLQLKSKTLFQVPGAHPCGIQFL